MGWARLMPPLTVGVTVAVMGVGGLAIPLAAAQDLGLSTDQTGAWILALYGVPGLLCLVLALVYRQPVAFGWTVSLPAYFASLAGEVPYSDLLGAALIGGLIVLTLGALGLTGRLAALVPAPVVLGVLAGAVLPFVARAFSALGEEPLLVGGTLAVYLLSRRFGGPRLPPVLPALLAGLALTALAGRIGALPGGWSLPPLAWTQPTFAPQAIAAVAPVFAALVAFQSNLPALVYLRNLGYHPPARTLEAVTGAASALAAPLGATPVCVAVLLVPLAAGPEAGDRETRHWAAAAIGVAFILIALGAGMAAELPAVLPLPVLAALAGLALVSVLDQALGQVTRGPLRLGPLFAFAVAVSDMSLLGLGSLFWALVFGTGVSFLLEGEALGAMRDAANAPPEPVAGTIQSG
jgi:benzoate membrane transport protein